ncbi:MAG: helix-turn-helix domain-containing protein [Taibaiella sp.]|nr:helix-turn-helix domain-containing protein [Taibaiella sp.]
MKHITILVPNGHHNLGTVACMAGACEMLSEANRYQSRQGTGVHYKVELAGITDTGKGGAGSVIGLPMADIATISSTGLVMIPATAIRSYDQALEGNAPLIDWIRLQYTAGAEVASMCSGAFLLAATGLLNGRSCSTHWMHAGTLKAQFPEVKLIENKLITDECGIYTNGGAYSFLHLMLYLIEKYYDRPTAIFISKMFQVEMDRQSQSAFAIFSAQKDHEDDVVRDAQSFIEHHVHDRISAEELSAKFAVGRRQFDRRFIKATGNTPAEYIQRVKVEWAKKALETTRKNVNEVMYDVGYNDVKAFREVFRKLTGLSPLDYRNRYNRDAMVS